MSKIIDYLFHHSLYNRVNEAYFEATTKLQEAYNMWIQENGKVDLSDYDYRKLIYQNIEEIRSLNASVIMTKTYLSKNRKAVEWLFYESTGNSQIPILNIQEYKYIGNSLRIKDFIKDLTEYDLIKKEHSRGIDKYLDSNNSTHSFEEIKKIVREKDLIKRMDIACQRAENHKLNSPRAWDIVAKGRTIQQIPFEELAYLVTKDYHTKEQFIELYEKNKGKFDLILGDSHNIQSFDQETLFDELDITMRLKTPFPELPSNQNYKVQQPNSDQTKRAILDSIEYGIQFKFAEDFTLDGFYFTRLNLETLEATFDDAVAKVKENNEAIKAYNQEKSGNSVVYIRDYEDSIDEKSELYSFIVKYNEDKRKKREEELKKKVSDLRNRISKGFRTSYFSLDCFSLYNYYPTSCEWKASESEWKVRNLIWNFKANPQYEEKLENIMTNHQEAVDEVVPLMKKCLEHFFDCDITNLTLVCISSSQKTITERRYKDFSERLCLETGMINGYDYIKIIKDGVSKLDPENTTGKSIPPELEVDTSFFKDKVVILFDDVITSGKSMERFRQLLEKNGANVIGGFSIGRTKHTREYPNPIDQL